MHIVLKHLESLIAYARLFLLILVLRLTWLNHISTYIAGEIN